MPNGLLPCVIDSNILIDLEHGHILRILFQLPLYLFTTRLVISELYVPDGELVQSYGVTVRRLAPDDYFDIGRLRNQHRRLSAEDVSTLILAEKSNVMLLTGNRHLRELASRRGIKVHGTLWILDQMIAANLIAPLVAAHALTEMLQAGSHFPRDECEKRLIQWGYCSRGGRTDQT